MSKTVFFITFVISINFRFSWCYARLVSGPRTSSTIYNSFYWPNITNLYISCKIFWEHSDFCHMSSYSSFSRFWLSSFVLNQPADILTIFYQTAAGLFGTLIDLTNFSYSNMATLTLASLSKSHHFDGICRGLFLDTLLGTHTLAMTRDVTDSHGERVDFASNEEVVSFF